MHTVKRLQVLLFNTNNSCQHYTFIYTLLNGSKYCYVSLTIKLDSHLRIQLNGQRVLFQTIQFNIGHLFAHSLNVKLFYLTHREDTIRCYHSGLEWTWDQWQCFCISQSSRIGSSPSGCLVSYTVNSFGGGITPTAAMQSVYSTASIDWATYIRGML